MSRLRRGLVMSVLLAAVLSAPVAQARVVVGEACPGERPVGAPSLAYAAYAKGPVVARTSAEGRVVRKFGRVNQNGARTVFGILSVVLSRTCEPLGYHVQLPVRPNGSSGFVKLAAVAAHPVRTRIDVDLSGHRLTLFRDDKQVLATTAGVGADGTPTPTGRYYVNQRLRAGNPSGPFGPGAIGISAFSPTLTDWAQGGPIAIHGTNDPSSVGRSASHGCIRLQNPVLRRLYRAALPGTPVVIHA
jgi:lipoprotein-anchoring transpeptidase ErfK/SrfK